MSGSRPREAQTPPNDAHLIQLVRGALGENKLSKDLPRVNVSSCKFVVTLHGVVPDAESRSEVENVVREVAGVRGVISKLVIL